MSTLDSWVFCCDCQSIAIECSIRNRLSHFSHCNSLSVTSWSTCGRDISVADSVAKNWQIDYNWCHTITDEWKYIRNCLRNESCWLTRINELNNICNLGIPDIYLSELPQTVLFIVQCVVVRINFPNRCASRCKVPKRLCWVCSCCW